MWQTQSQRSKRSSMKHFSGERLVHVLLYTYKIKERSIIWTNQLTSEKPRAPNVTAEEMGRALLQGHWSSAQPFFLGKEIQLLLHKVPIPALCSSSNVPVTGVTPLLLEFEADFLHGTPPAARTLLPARGLSVVQSDVLQFCSKCNQKRSPQSLGFLTKI